MFKLMFEMDFIDLLLFYLLAGVNIDMTFFLSLLEGDIDFLKQ